MLNVRFEEVLTDPYKWEASVKAYNIIDVKTNKKIAKFYADLYPREGKYSHAAAFDLVPAYLDATGHYQQPVSAIVANLSKPSDGKPALLSHDSVETLFHEFGHIMHQTLTKVEYPSLSGSNVLQDFVEAPSQMLENWVWSKEALKKITSHYQTKAPMPDALIEKLVHSKKLNIALINLKQVFYASIDMAYHTWNGTDPLDTTEMYQRLFDQMTLYKSLSGITPEAAFGHLMGGYDAGYYGYLWSKVYAQDMFSRFSKDGLFNSATGLAYRQAILEQGDSQSPWILLQQFLGRAPNSDAFFRDIQE